jgi:transposase InsO family protein/predicted aspartyl protease
VKEDSVAMDTHSPEDSPYLLDDRLRRALSRPVKISTKGQEEKKALAEETKDEQQNSSIVQALQSVKNHSISADNTSLNSQTQSLENVTTRQKVETEVDIDDQEEMPIIREMYEDQMKAIREGAWEDAAQHFESQIQELKEQIESMRIEHQKFVEEQQKEFHAEFENQERNFSTQISALTQKHTRELDAAQERELRLQKQIEEIRAQYEKELKKQEERWKLEVQNEKRTREALAEHCERLKLQISNYETQLKRITSPPNPYVVPSSSPVSSSSQPVLASASENPVATPLMSTKNINVSPIPNLVFPNISTTSVNTLGNKLIGKPPKFTGQNDQDVKDWIADFNSFVLRNGLQETVALSYLEEYLDGEAKTWWRSENHSNCTLSEALTWLSRMYGKTDEYYRQQLQHRVWKADEPLRSYVVHIRDLIRKCNPDMSETEKVKTLLRGLPADYCKLISMSKPTTLKDAIELALSLETAEKESKRVQTRPGLRVNALEDQDVAALDQQRSPQKSKSTSVCYYCQKAGHHWKMCKTRMRDYSKYQQRKEKSTAPPSSTYTANIPTPLLSSPSKQITPVKETAVLALEMSQTDSISSPVTRDSPFTPDASVNSLECDDEDEDLEEQLNREEHKQEESNCSPLVFNECSWKGTVAQIQVEGIQLNSLIDTGSAISGISGEMYSQLFSKIPLMPFERRVTTANNTRLEVLGQIPLKITVGKTTKVCNILVVKNFRFAFLLGVDALKALDLTIDFNAECLHTRDGIKIPLVMRNSARSEATVMTIEDVKLQPGQSVIIPCEPTISPRLLKNSGNLLMIVQHVSPLGWQKYGIAAVKGLVQMSADGVIPVLIRNCLRVETVIPKGTVVALAELIDTSSSEVFSLEVNQDKSNAIDPDAVKYIQNLKIDNQDFTEEMKEKLKKLLMEYVDVFATDYKYAGRVTVVKHSIETGNHPPIRIPPRRLSEVEKEVQRKEVQMQLEKGVIRPSNSPWCFPPVVVKKKDGSWRHCVDFRKLNEITRKDVYPLPRVDEIFDCLHGSKFFTLLDAISGYWQIEVEEKDREKTAFASVDGLFEYTVMPFGLTNGPATYQRLMDVLMAGLRWKEVLDYIDDLMVHSKTFEQHLATLEEVFKRARKVNLKFKITKCKFGLAKVPFLGHIVSKDGIHTDPEKIAAVKKFAPPKDLSALKSFLGLSGYYRRFIKDYSKIAVPLTNLLKKDVKFEWTSECQQAFDILKEALISAPVLRFADFTKPFYLHTDASNYAVGAVLCQKDDNDHDYPIAYASKLLSPAERNYSITEKEALAAVWAVLYFRPYLYGRRFTLVTDHKALKWLFNFRDPTGRVARWAVKLQAYDFDIVHRSGSAHCDADALSRLSQAEDKSLSEVAAIDINEAQKELIKLQHRDTTLIPWIHYLKHGEFPTDMSSADQKKYLRHVDKLVLEDNLLLRIDTILVGRRRRFKRRIVVPNTKRTEVLQACHEHPLAGHFGRTKTYERVMERFWWMNMYEDVKQWVKSCTNCAAKKDRDDLRLGELHSIVVSRPMEIVGVDIVGPLPETRDGNRFITAFTDHFTKWAEVCASARADAGTIALLFVERIVCRFGAPEKLLSDRGKQFLSKLSKEIYKLLCVEKLNTSGYHPQTDGLNERFNRTLVTSISKYVNEHQDDWDRYIPYCSFAYNTSVQSSTAETPFFLTYGRDPIMPIELKYGVISEDTMDRVTYRQTLVEGLKNVYEKVNYLHELQRQQMESRVNSTRKDHKFRESDLVWLYTPHCKTGKSPKLSHFWHGPFRIIEMTSPMNARLQTTSGKKLNQIVHVSRLKLYEESSKSPDDEAKLLPDDSFDPDQEPVLPALEKRDVYLDEQYVDDERVRRYRDEDFIYDDDFNELSALRPQTVSSELQPSRLDDGSPVKPPKSRKKRKQSDEGSQQKNIEPRDIEERSITR